jgi:hypothetical protein
MKKIDKLIEDFLNTGKIISEYDDIPCDDCGTDINVKQEPDMSNLYLCPSCYTDRMDKEHNTNSRIEFKDDIWDNEQIKRKEVMKKLNNYFDSYFTNYPELEARFATDNYATDNFTIVIENKDPVKPISMEISNKSSDMGEFYPISNNKGDYIPLDWTPIYNDIEHDTFIASFGDDEFYKNVEEHLNNFLSLNRGDIGTTTDFMKDFMLSKVRGSEVLFNKMIKHLEGITGGDEIKLKDIMRKLYDYVEGSEDISREKMVKLIKKLGEKDLEKDVEDLFNFVAAHKEYEYSFCDCIDEKTKKPYFECSNVGDKSKITELSMTKLLREYYNKSKTLEQVVKELYDSINSENVNKYDIVSKTSVVVGEGNNTITIPPESKIEIKKITGNKFHLSEFLSIYKRSANIDKYLTQNNYIDGYNKIINGVYNKIKDNPKGIIDKIKSQTFGLFLDNYEFVPFDDKHIKIDWGLEGQRGTIRRKDPITGEVTPYTENRLTITFEVIKGAKTYKWGKEQGNCNLLNESKENTDYIGEYVNKLLDL